MTDSRAVSLVATGAQIGVAITRVLAFSYAVLIFGSDQANAAFLLTVGYLPFIAFFDILAQSFSRVSAIQQTYFLDDIAPYRIAYAFGSLVLILSVGAWASVSPDRYSYPMILCFLLGAVGYLWEGWLAIPSRSLAFACLEIVSLVTVTAGHYLDKLPTAALVICFFSFPMARLAVLLIPGQAPTGQAPQALGAVRPSRYIGFSLAQQSVGAASASLPALYAQAAGNFAGLPVQLASFRIMHGLGAMASLVINALGSRIFYSQAILEINIIKKMVLTIESHKFSLVVLVFLAVTTMYILDFKFIYSILLYALLISLDNFRSSYFINIGSPKNTLWIQLSILTLSISAIGYLNREVLLCLPFLLFYVVMTKTLKCNGGRKLKPV